LVDLLLAYSWARQHLIGYKVSFQLLITTSSTVSRIEKNSILQDHSGVWLTCRLNERRVF